jgi:hypothetical protein
VVVRKEEKSNEPRYLEIKVKLADGTDEECTLGTDIEGFGVDKDRETGDLHVSTNSYGPLRNLVIEGNI